MLCRLCPCSCLGGFREFKTGVNREREVSITRLRGRGLTTVGNTTVLNQFMNFVKKHRWTSLLINVCSTRSSRVTFLVRRRQEPRTSSSIGLKYELYDKNGKLYSAKGAYNLCDNGYHKWSTMMEPSKRPADDDDYNWTEMLESLTKDVEKLFGELKQEFAILNYGSRFNSLTLMDDIFLACCAKEKSWQVWMRCGI